MTQDQVFVPSTRSELGLQPFDPAKEDLFGSRVSAQVKKELWEALGDSPIGAVLGASSYLVRRRSWNLHDQSTTYLPFCSLADGLLTSCSTLLANADTPLARIVSDIAQTNIYVNNHGFADFKPSAVMFADHHYSQVVVSDIGIALWLVGVAYSIWKYGFVNVFSLYLVPYLWCVHLVSYNQLSYNNISRVNHWLVLITFLQHTDPLLPHYRAPEFTFPRGALSTLDRNLLADCGKVMAWIGAHATNGISETHVLHHVSSKIPHYNA